MIGRSVISNCSRIARNWKICKFRKSRLFHCSAIRQLQPTSENHLVDFYAENASKHTGDYKDIASQSDFKRPFADIALLSRDYIDANGKGVWLRGRVSKIRSKGSACFVVIRSKSLYTIQACCFREKSAPEMSQELLDFLSSIPLESIVDIYGELVPAEVHSCSQSDVEISIKKAFVVSRAPVVLPFLIDDASRYPLQPARTALWS